MPLSPGHSNIEQVHWERTGNDASSHPCPEGPWFYIVFVLKVLLLETMVF